MARIEPEELHAALRAGAVTLIDVRSAAVRGRAGDHIPEDVHLLPGEVETWQATLPRDRKIVTYCTCPGEMTSGLVAEYLAHRGFDAAALQGGLDAWKAAGLPVSPLPRAPER
jgi:rhodanese-related sulfurtransferase